MHALDRGDDRAQERLRRIESITDSALAHLRVEDLLVELLDRIRELLSTDTAAVLLLDESTGHLVATAARGIEDEVYRGVRIPLGSGFAGRVAAEKRPVALNHVDHTTVLNPVLREAGIHALLGVPLVTEGHVIGVLHVGALAQRTFTDEEAELLQVVGDRVALAVEVRRSRMRDAAAAELQRSLLPGTLPRFDGLDMAARYVPGEQGGLGGDWYDVFTLPGGRLGLVIGDVVGRGLRAAVVMGRLRSALRAYALDGGTPADVLGRVDRKVQHFEPGEMATILYGVLDPSFDRFTLSSAGHLPPTISSVGVPPATVDLRVDPPVGVRLAIRRHNTVVDLPLGATMCFHTDGLLERRKVPLEDRYDLLLDALAQSSSLPAENVCAHLMNRLVGGEPPGDDIAVLVLRRLVDEPERPLELTLPAIPASLAHVRAAVRRWLSRVDASDADRNDILLAMGEACSNAVEHAYGPAGGEISVHLALDGPAVVATITDDGSWREARGVGRGRGTRIIEQVSDDVTVEAGPVGTRVVIRRMLGRDDKRER